MNSEARSGFLWTLELEHADGTIEREQVHNLIPEEGLNHMQSVVFKGASQVATWYIALFEGNYNPDGGITAATFPSVATECTAYSPSTRPEFVEGSVVSGDVDNSASRAEFTFTANKTVYGGVITSASAKGATTGVLMSAVRFSSPKVCEEGAILRVVAANSLVST